MRRFTWIGLVALGAAAVVALCMWNDHDAMANGKGHGPPVLEFDVSQDGSTFSFQGPTTGAGFPAAGATFIVQGYVYPAGTLQGGAVSGTNADGSPAFPDDVIGAWSCRGWFTRDCDPGVSGPIIVGNQLWDLDPEEAGAATIVTEGIDLSLNDVDLNVPFIRAITGGTGPFDQAGGEQTNINFGFNDSFGLDSTHVLDLRGSGDD